MAISAVSQSQFIPTLENHFGLGVRDEREWRTGVNATSEQTWGFTEEVVVWKNPHLVITPYIPSERNNELIKTFQLAINPNSLTPEESLFFNPDVTTVILLNVDLKTLINFSEVSKCGYLATQVNVLWEGQLSQLLPQVKCISSELCSFTPDQQFKIIHRRFFDEIKPYTAKYQRNEQKCSDLKEQMAKIDIPFQEAGGKEASDRYLAGLMKSVNMKESKDGQAFNLSVQLVSLERHLSFISGKNYDGTPARLAEKCHQERLLIAINEFIPNAFNNQETFDKVIQKSEAIKNTTAALPDLVSKDNT